MAATPTSPIETPPFTARELDAMRQTVTLWKGTPHRDRMAKVGVGIDCVHFLREVFVAAGVLPEFVFPFYATNWGYGRSNNLMERMLVTACHAEVVTTPQDGDVVVFRVGRQTNHCGVCLDGLVWHAQFKRGVRFDDLATFDDKIQSYVRLTARGFKKRPEELQKSDLINE